MVMSYEDEDDDLMVVSLLRHSYDRIPLSAGGIATVFGMNV